MCYIGISFGPVFTASIGGERREFMLVGDVVNTAGEALLEGGDEGGLRVQVLRSYDICTAGQRLMDRIHEYCGALHAPTQ